MKHEEIHRICKKYNITNYTINGDGTIDVDGNVDLYDKGLIKLPLRFNKVSGYFYCQNNKLETLEGSPLEVGGGFYCNNNKLISLEGAPLEVGIDFDCNNNKLISLEGAPLEVGIDFDCTYNLLKSLKGAPKKVGGFFYCFNNLVELDYKNYIKRVDRINKLKQL